MAARAIRVLVVEDFEPFRQFLNANSGKQHIAVGQNRHAEFLDWWTLARGPRALQKKSRAGAAAPAPRPGREVTP